MQVRLKSQPGNPKNEKSPHRGRGTPPLTPPSFASLTRVWLLRSLALSSTLVLNPPLAKNLYPPLMQIVMACINFRHHELIFLYVFSMLNLSIATYNVRGLRDKEKCDKVIHWGKIFQFDVLCLQETFISSKEEVDAFRKEWGGPVFFSPSLSPNHSGGVGIAFKGSLKCDKSQVKSNKTIFLRLEK